MENIVNQINMKEQSITETIKATLSEIKAIGAKVKKLKNDLKGTLLSNAHYFQAVEEAKTANVGVKAARAEVFKSNADALKMAEELKSVRSDLKLNKESLSECLISYEKQSGLDHIESDEGVLIKINKIASVQLKLL